MFVTDRFDAAVYDCIIVGSGPAGISLALALAKARKRVLVFESGDADQPRSGLSNTIGYGHYAGGYWNGHWYRALGGTSPWRRRRALAEPLSIQHGLYGCALQCMKKSPDHEMARFMTAQSGRPYFHYDITAHAKLLPSPSRTCS
jgi:choline dehydrogenase-like flavoprotein